MGSATPALHVPGPLTHWDESSSFCGDSCFSRKQAGLSRGLSAAGKATSESWDDTASGGEAWLMVSSGEAEGFDGRWGGDSEGERVSG